MREAASFIASQTAIASSSAAGHLLERAVVLFHSWSTRRKLTDLAEFDNHMLADIGLTRDDVDYALALPFAENAAFELQRRALRNRNRDWRASS